MDFESQILIFGPNSNVILGILFSESYFINQTQTSFPYVGGNLGSLLNGDVSVMAFKHKETGVRGF